MPGRHFAPVLVLIALLVAGTSCPADEAPTRREAAAALRRAVEFVHSRAALQGGYVWIYSADLTLRQGEGLAYDQRIWVQPPGTPAVGLAMLDAYEATGDDRHFQAAYDAARALVQGQLHSGGWPYSVTFDPAKRLQTNYRVRPSKGKPDVKVDLNEPGGWAVWRKRRYRDNMTIVDDDTTPAALRLLIRVDRLLEFRDESIHEAAEYGLASLLKAQYPIGAWSHNYDRFPRKSPDPEFYPVKRATYPKDWSRTWTKDFEGCYVINDRISLNVIHTMLDAWDAYRKRAYLQSALRGGDFLLRARMPEPQPAWAQQYDRNVQPVWDRPFEPPAITGFESQDALETLLELYRRTGEERFLEAVPRPLAYLKKSRLPDGKLARFYELKTNRPLFFTTKYELTYDRGKMPDHYGFVFESRLDEIEAKYEALKAGGTDAELPAPSRAELTRRAHEVIDAMDARGAWTEPGIVRDPKGRKVEPKGGVVKMQTFVDNVELLCRYLEAR